MGMGIGGLVLGISVRVEFGRGCIDRRVALVFGFRSHFSFLIFSQDLAWFHRHGFTWYAAIIHSFYPYEDLSNRPARSLVASVTIISLYPSTERVSLHFHAGSHFSCPSSWRHGFRIVLCVLPRLVYPSSYSSQYGTSNSRRKAHISA
jgi:hypothetical protein